MGKEIMKRSFLLLLLAFPALLAAQPSKVTANAVLAEFDRLAALPLWPGFDPRQTPLAIYDGERTILVRHPSSPPEFKPEGDLRVFAGRHQEMRANTSIELGGVQTATLIVEPEKPRSAREWASVMIHETFHAFQRQRHPQWAGNEAELFLYPVDDASLLASRRLETEAFRRALAARKTDEAFCWTGQALAARYERFGKMTAGAVGYERGTELNEGLAAFVENLSLGKAGGPEIPIAGYGAGDVRSRAYSIGFAEAALLDRFDPAWRKTLEEGPGSSLDERLYKAVTGKSAPACGFKPAETAGMAARAREDVAKLAGERRSLREAFLGRPGWKIEIAAGKPLFPQGFDPLNVVLVAKGEILHRRFVKLGSDAGTVEVLDREALTRAAGEHPLFNGVAGLQVTGLPEEPKTRQDGDFLVIETSGVTARLKGAKVEKGKETLKVTVP
jgi:hypothetical protein